MNLFQVSVAASTLLFASQSYAIDCYNLDQKSVAYQTCMLRKENQDRDYRLRIEREEKEKKEASARYNEKWAREAKEEKREAKEKSDKYWENERIRKEQKEKEQQQKTPMTAEGMKGMAEALAGLSEMAAMFGQTYVKRVSELSDTRQCKEAHALIKSESRGGDKMMLNMAEIWHGFVAESCDKDRKTAAAHLSRAARNGSMLAKMKLDELKKAGAENEKAVTEVISAPDSATPSKCKVNDVDIAASYSGECKDGFAHGKGVAKGRDEYRGTFSEGNVNGQGVYIWGASSDWAGERYEGGYRNGGKYGFGVSGIDKNAKNMEVVHAYKKVGILEKNRYVRRGYFENDIFVVPCKTPDACLNILSKAEQDFEKGNQFYQKKEYSEAFILFKKAAEQGNVGAQSSLGWMYMTGLGVAQNVDEGQHWLHMAALRGFPVAQFLLGGLYKNIDATESVRWYRKAADQGSDMAQHALGLMYENGQGVDKNDDEAVRWYRKAAEQGNSDAKAQLEKRGIQ